LLGLTPGYKRVRERKRDRYRRQNSDIEIGNVDLRKRIGKMQQIKVQNPKEVLKKKNRQIKIRDKKINRKKYKS
jgi:hypothetical protein